jgi:hypothetical protein
LRSRWGTLSVRDHRDPRTLIPEILLYDRLIMPIPASHDDWPRWSERGWDPKLLTDRTLQLDDLVEQVRWGADLLKSWREGMKSAQANLDLQAEREVVKEAVKEAVPYMFTRRVLARDRRYVDRDGVAPEVVAAYPSLHDMEADRFWVTVDNPASQAEVSLLLARRFLVPHHDKDPEGLLREIIKLAKDKDFQAKRQALYQWEREILSGPLGLKPDEAVGKMAALLGAYEQAVRAAEQKVYKKAVFTVGAATVSTASALLGNPLGFASGALTIAGFISMDRKINVQAGEAGAAAVFHEAGQALEQSRWAWVKRKVLG